LPDIPVKVLSLTATDVIEWSPAGTLVTGSSGVGGLNSSPGSTSVQSCNEPTPALFRLTACAEYVPTTGPAVTVSSVPLEIGIKCEKSPVKTFGGAMTDPPPVTSYVFVSVNVTRITDPGPHPCGNDPDDLVIVLPENV